MFRARRIGRFALCAAATLLLVSGKAAAQAITSPVNFGFAVDRGRGISTRENAIAVDSKNVYFAWYYLGDQVSGTPGQLKYEAFPLVVNCQHVPCGFVPPTPTTVDVIGPTPLSFTISIALDPKGVPHIVYQDSQGELKHAELCPCADTLHFGWVTETIPIPGGIFTSMAVDKNGTVHVVSSSGGTISYITKSNGVWSGVESIFGPVLLSSLSLAVDSVGIPQVLWADHRSSFNELVYAHRPWNSDFEIITHDDAEWASLALDKNDNPNVSYWGWVNNGSLTSELVYATKSLSFGSWQRTAVDSFDLPCCFSFPWFFHQDSVAVSPGGFPRISYGYDYPLGGGRGSGGVAFARSDGLSWQKQALDFDPGGALNSISLAVDAADISHVLFVITQCGLGSCSDILYYDRLSNANTPTGNGVKVNLVDPAGSPNPITVTFTQVSQAGLTSVSMADASAGPALPPNFHLGNSPVYFDVSTTALYSPPVTVCFHYGNVSNPASLAVFHDEHDVMVNRTFSNDTVTHTICAQVNSLSLFAVLEGQALPQCAADVSGSVGVTRSGFGYNVMTKRYGQNVVLTNAGQSAISGPIYLALDGLSGNATLANAIGKTACAAPTGSSYVSVAGPLNAGAQTTLSLQFSDPTNSPIRYTPRILAGAGQP